MAVGKRWSIAESFGGVEERRRANDETVFVPTTVAVPGVDASDSKEAANVFEVDGDGEPMSVHAARLMIE